MGNGVGLVTSLVLVYGCFAVACLLTIHSYLLTAAKKDNELNHSRIIAPVIGIMAITVFMTIIGVKVFINGAELMVLSSEALVSTPSIKETAVFVFGMFEVWLGIYVLWLLVKQSRMVKPINDSGP